MIPIFFSRFVFSVFFPSSFLFHVSSFFSLRVSDVFFHFLPLFALFVLSVLPLLPLLLIILMCLLSSLFVLLFCPWSGFLTVAHLFLWIPGVHPFCVPELSLMLFIRVFHFLFLFLFSVVFLFLLVVLSSCVHFFCSLLLCFLIFSCLLHSAEVSSKPRARELFHVVVRRDEATSEVSNTLKEGVFLMRLSEAVKSARVCDGFREVLHFRTAHESALAHAYFGGPHNVWELSFCRPEY